MSNEEEMDHPRIRLSREATPPIYQVPVSPVPTSIYDLNQRENANYGEGIPRVQPYHGLRQAKNYSADPSSVSSSMDLVDLTQNDFNRRNEGQLQAQGFRRGGPGLRLSTYGPGTRIPGGPMPTIIDRRNIHPRSRVELTNAARPDSTQTTGRPISGRSPVTQIRPEEDSNVSINRLVHPDLINRYSRTNDWFDPFETRKFVAIKLSDKAKIRKAIYHNIEGTDSITDIDNMLLLQKYNFNGYIDTLDNEFEGSESASGPYQSMIVAAKKGRNLRPQFFFDHVSDRISRNVYIQRDLGIGLGEAKVMNPMFQWNERADPRTDPLHSQIGRKYAEMYNKQSTLYLRPGRVRFHTSLINVLLTPSGAGLQETYLSSGGPGVLTKVMKVLSFATMPITIVSTFFNKLFNNGRVCSFQQQYPLYAQFFNQMAKIVAINFNLMVSGRYVGMRELHLAQILQSGSTKEYFNAQFIPFRIVGDISVNDTFANEIAPNPLEASLNDRSMEAASDTAQVDAINAVLNLNMSGLRDAGRRLMTRLGASALSNVSEVAAVMSGRSRIHLPGIWSASTFSRSVQFDLEFVSPYGNRASVFENIELNRIALLSMSLSRQTGRFVSTTPFHLQAHLKKRFNIEFGMISNLSFTEETDVNSRNIFHDSLNMTASVSMADFTPIISLTNGFRGPFRGALEMMQNNSGLMEYLNMISGLTMFETRNFLSRFDRAYNLWLSGRTTFNQTNFNTWVSNLNIPIMRQIQESFFTAQLPGEMGDRSYVQRMSDANQWFRSEFGASVFLNRTISSTRTASDLRSDPRTLAGMPETNRDPITENELQYPTTDGSAFGSFVPVSTGFRNLREYVNDEHYKTDREDEDTSIGFLNSMSRERATSIPESNPLR